MIRLFDVGTCSNSTASLLAGRFKSNLHLAVDRPLLTLTSLELRHLVKPSSSTIHHFELQGHSTFPNQPCDTPNGGRWHDALPRQRELPDIPSTVHNVPSASITSTSDRCGAIVKRQSIHQLRAALPTSLPTTTSRAISTSTSAPGVSSAAADTASSSTISTTSVAQIRGWLQAFFTFYIEPARDC